MKTPLLSPAKIALLSLGLLCTSAHATLMKCIDENGNVTYTNAGTGKGCKAVASEGVTVVPGYKPLNLKPSTPVTPAAIPPAPVPTPPSTTVTPIPTPPVPVTAPLTPTTTTAATPSSTPPTAADATPPATPPVVQTEPLTPEPTAPSVSAEEKARLEKETKRKMLTEELAQAREALNQAEQDLKAQEATRLGNEQNYAKVQERLQPYKYQFDLHSQKVKTLEDALKKL